MLLAHRWVGGRGGRHLLTRRHVARHHVSSITQPAVTWPAAEEEAHLRGLAAMRDAIGSLGALENKVPQRDRPATRQPNRRKHLVFSSSSTREPGLETFAPIA